MRMVKDALHSSAVVIGGGCGELEERIGLLLLTAPSILLNGAIELLVLLLLLL